MKYANIFGKFGVPNPVTGSHPFTAVKPLVPHPGLVPFTISFKISGCAYNAGFTNPTVLFPFAMRSSFMRLMIAPKIGALAEVPPAAPSLP